MDPRPTQLGFVWKLRAKEAAQESYLFSGMFNSFASWLALKGLHAKYRSPTLSVGTFRFPLFTRRTSSSLSRSEEHTSELQSRQYLVCRLLLEKKNINIRMHL